METLEIIYLYSSTNNNNNNNKLLFKHDKNYSKADVVVYLHVIKSYLP